ncbi:MAG: hypothetical protein HY515_00555 [Candidatus Aenigmarchaeota archaeon]|nr:hypothetical protein [Candidatus Aenigmarchaeota archaeon]
MCANWVRYGDFSEYDGAPTVFLDQNVACKLVARKLFVGGIRVARAMKISIPDKEIMRDAHRYGALILTMDPDFEMDESALVLPPEIRLRKDSDSLVLAAMYVHGRTKEIPSYPNGHHLNAADRALAEEAYWGRLNKLRTRFAGG